MVMQVPLTRGLFALVDDADYDRVAALKWCASEGKSGNMYGHRRLGRKQIKLHRFILDAPPGLVVDHIDGNGLNNTRANIRICTHKENSWNYHRRAMGMPKYKGVNRDGRKFRARIRVNYALISLGHYSDEVEAAMAYDRAARQYFGTYANTNFPLPPMIIPEAK